MFDHGAAPPGSSDRIFRFNYLRERLDSRVSGLAGFAFPRDQVPASMTRLQAVAATAPVGPAAAAHGHGARGDLGALEDPRVRAAPEPGRGQRRQLPLPGVPPRRAARPSALFEHHTGELTPASPGPLRRAAWPDGSISNEDVFADKGHGALVLEARCAARRTCWRSPGPRRGLLVDSGREPYLAVPHGDMMLAGNFGLLRAYAGHDDAVREAVERRLGGALATVA